MSSKGGLSQKMNLNKGEEITTVDEIMPVEKMKNDMQEILEVFDALSAVKHQEKEIKSEIENLLTQSAPLLALRKEYEQKLLNIEKYNKLAETTAEKNRILQSQKDSLSSELQNRSKNFTAAQEILIEKKKFLQKLGTTEATRREIVLLTQQKNFRNRQIVAQMRDKIFIVKATPSILPGSSSDEKNTQNQSQQNYYLNFTINGQGVSRDGNFLFDDEAAAALSSIAQCLKLLEKLYQIPLRFQVFPFGSRSFVCSVENFELFQHQMKSFQKSIENFSASESSEKKEEEEILPESSEKISNSEKNSSENVNSGSQSLSSNSASSFTVDQEILQKNLVPLFFIKGGDKMKYLSAVKYLNKNIFHMCKMKNLPRIGLSNNSKCIVENIRFLLDAFLASENV